MAARSLRRNPNQLETDAIKASQLINVLNNHAIGKLETLSDSRIAAARAALPYLRPALSAIEQTVHNADDTLTEEQLIDKFQAVIADNPGLLQRLNAVQAKLKPGVISADISGQKPSDNAASQSTGMQVQQSGKTGS
jgi:hypothetical protein